MEKTERNYADYAVRHKIFSQLILAKMFPNLKEVTESIGALRALQDLKLSFNDGSINCYVLGDGSSPRTGSMLALSSSWNIFSIDPKLRKRKYMYVNKLQKIEIPRLTCYQIKAEDFTDIQYTNSLSIIVCVHSHANFEDFYNRIPSPKIAIAIPCCVKHELTNRDPDISYIDNNITSPKNTIMIWTDK